MDSTPQRSHTITDPTPHTPWPPPGDLSPSWRTATHVRGSSQFNGISPSFFDSIAPARLAKATIRTRPSPLRAATKPSSTSVQATGDEVSNRPRAKEEEEGEEEYHENKKRWSIVDTSLF